MKIVFLGDSLVWGQYGGDFVAYVANALPQHSVINEGVGGDTVANLLARVEDVLDTHQPDIMVINVGGNDAVSHSMPAVHAYYRQAKGIEGGAITPDDYRMTYRELLTQIQLNYVQPMVMLSPTEYNAHLIQVRQQYNDIARDVAHSLNVPTINITQHFPIQQPVERPDVDMGFILDIGKKSRAGWRNYDEERTRWGYQYTFDGMHLLPETAPRFADIIVHALQPYLK
jgi:lysophospholipase L1-like esterase